MPIISEKLGDESLFTPFEIKGLEYIVNQGSNLQARLNALAAVLVDKVKGSLASGASVRVGALLPVKEKERYEYLIDPKLCETAGLKNAAHIEMRSLKAGDVSITLEEDADIEVLGKLVSPKDIESSNIEGPILVANWQEQIPVFTGRNRLNRNPLAENLTGSRNTDDLEAPIMRDVTLVLAIVAQDSTNEDGSVQTRYACKAALDLEISEESRGQVDALREIYSEARMQQTSRNAKKVIAENLAHPYRGGAIS
jgi:hypothetical protein